METATNNLPCTIKDVRFVVDNMLCGLGKFLRKCGSDTKCLENSDDHEEAVKIALKEDRIILTSGAPYFQLKSYLPEGKCFNVQCTQTAKEQAMTIFKHFNIEINEEDVFSRCSDNIEDETEIRNFSLKEYETRLSNCSFKECEYIPPEFKEKTGTTTIKEGKAKLNRCSYNKYEMDYDSLESDDEDKFEMVFNF